MNPSGSPVNYLAAFLGGLLVSFTPCIYPLIPVTVGYIGTHSSGSKLKGFLLSLAYVSGIALVYSGLGIFASLTGTIFGLIAANPITRASVGIVVILFGLSMLDLFVLPVPSIIKAPARKREGYFAAFFLGISSGLMASPCLTPVLGSILAHLATKKDLLYGAALLFVFAYGMGFTLILAGTFSGILVNLPKVGKWSLYIKRACAFILIAAGLYFIVTALMGG